MKRIISLFLVGCILSFSGCGNLSPRNQEKINNRDGKIDEIRSNQNGVTAEIGKLRQNAELQNSQLKEVQSGLLNLSASLSHNENNGGIQILQGDGALIFVFSLGVIGMLLFWYRDRAIKNEKIANIMGKEIARLNDPILNDNILRSAMHTEVELPVYDILIKHRQEIYSAGD